MGFMGFMGFWGLPIPINLMNISTIKNDYLFILSTVFSYS